MANLSNVPATSSTGLRSGLFTVSPIKVDRVSMAYLRPNTFSTGLLIKYTRKAKV